MVDYRYAADGRKLQEKVKEGRFLQTSRDYVGEFIYENGALKKILFEGGYVDMNGDVPVYMFFIKDHLGSVRAVVSETGEVQQTNEYYPYGDLFGTSGTGSSGNRFRFTGKELSAETGLYDFSARFLHTKFGRFTTIDPLAEKYPGISPYAYCNGNPVNFVDPDGMDWIKNMETWQYEWRDDIQADSEIPDGYRYVGPTSNDILSDLNISPQYRIQNSSVFYIAGEIESCGIAITAVNKGISANMRVSVQLSYDAENASSNNLIGVMFEGITFTASSVQTSIDANNPYMIEMASLFEIGYGNEIFSEIMSEPGDSYIKQSGTKVLTGSINIPASKLASNKAFGEARIKSGVVNYAMFYKNSEISWPIEKWPMFRLKK